MSLHNVKTQCLDTMWQCGNVQYGTVQYSTVQYSTVQYSIVPVQYSTVQYSTVQCSTVQCSTVQYRTVLLVDMLQYSTVKYSDTTRKINSTVQTVQYNTVHTVTGEEDGVRRWQTPYSTLCGVSVTGAASLVAECGMWKLTFCSKNAENNFNPFLGHFQKSVTGSESMCRFVMTSSSQKWY